MSCRAGKKIPSSKIQMSDKKVLARYRLAAVNRFRFCHVTEYRNVIGDAFLNDRHISKFVDRPIRVRSKDIELNRIIVQATFYAVLKKLVLNTSVLSLSQISDATTAKRMKI